jgi:putative transposase
MQDDDEHRLAIASFRYRVIAEAVEAQGEGVTDAIEQAATETYLDHDSREVQPKLRTLWRWLCAYRDGGLLALRPKARSDRGQLRALDREVLDRAVALRRDNQQRATRTLIDILERAHAVERGAIARSTLDRHLDRLGVSRRRLHSLGRKTYRKVHTDAPFELLIADFHHGPYVRVGWDDEARRALLLLFLDHFSRYVIEGRYYLHEDFAALRFGFRRVLLAYGCFALLYIDNGPSFHSRRFHAACSHKAIDIDVVHSKAYVAEGRGACERLNRTIKEQFESEVRVRSELFTLDELNASFEAWLAERYHRDVHSETGETPLARFQTPTTCLRAAPELSLVDELLRLREKRTVHRKWSTVEVNNVRYLVDSALRGRRLFVLHDPMDLAYVLIEYDGRIVERAFPQKPGQVPQDAPDASAPAGVKTDYLAMLRADYEARQRAELSALRLQPAPAQADLSLLELVALLEQCRAAALTDNERSEVSALFRKLRPIDPEAARAALASACRRLGQALHLRVYLDALQTTLVRQRTKGGKTP